MIYLGYLVFLFFATTSPVWCLSEQNDVIPRAALALLQPNNFPDDGGQNYDEYDIEPDRDEPLEAVPKVLNGYLATPGDYPHQVSLQATNQQNMHFCGASIISPRLLLTAAHCFQANSVPHIRVVAGAHNLLAQASETEQARDVTHIIIHENYEAETWNNDIALLILNESLKFDDKYVKPITLRDPAWALPKWATVSGWGIGSTSRSLNFADIQIRDHVNCREKFKSKNYTVADNTICAGGLRDACKGDSGGPLTCSKNVTNGQEHRYLCGIVSWGVSCTNSANKYYPGVYTDVANYESWIKKYMRAWDCELGAPAAEIIKLEETNATLEERLEKRTRDLIAALTASESQKLPAHVPRPTVRAEVDTTLNFTIEIPGGQDLSLCLWERNIEGQRQVIVIDEQVIGKGGKTAIPGVSVMVRNQGLKDGKCGLKIEAISEQDLYSSWTCTLITPNGTVFTGEVRVEGASAAELVSRSNFAFSSALLNELPHNRNVVFSPFGLGLLLYMARAGARGQTATQIENALWLPETTDLDDLVPIRQGLNEILKNILLPTEDYNVTLANRMFIEEGFEIHKNFTKISKATLDVSVTPLNFADGLNASETINSWARERTNGRIDELFQPVSISRDTKLVLVNAIYFQSPWKYPFDPRNTRRANFYQGWGMEKKSKDSNSCTFVAPISNSYSNSYSRKREYLFLFP